jgi:hypothetical protein
VSKKKNKKNPEWARAKKLCRLSQEEVAMALRLGFTPRALIGNIPSPTQRWKAPVKEWVRDLYDKKFPGEAKPREARVKPAGKLPANEDDLYGSLLDDIF